MAAAREQGSFGAQWRWLSWVLMAIVAVAVLVIAATGDQGPQSDGERVSELAATIRCPQCRGQSVAESNVTVARQIRADIAERVDRGETDEQIQQAYVDIFKDESILLTPSGEGFSSLVWIVPVIAAALGTLALGLAFARWRGAFAGGGATRRTDESSDADRKLVAKARDKRDRTPASASDESP